MLSEVPQRSVVLCSLLESRLGGFGVALGARCPDGEALLLGLGQVEGVQVQLGTTWYGASLTKEILGVLTAQLVDERVVDVDDSLRTFLSELPDWAGAISLRHLLHHTSGLPSSATLSSVIGVEEKDWDNGLVLAGLTEQGPPSRPPGRQFEYSNVGYICLATALERATAQSLSTLAGVRVFEALGMSDSHLGDPPPGLSVPIPAPPKTLGDGGLWTTAGDLLRWNDALNARHFGVTVHDRAESTGVLDDGTPIDYAWGVRVTKHNGERTLTHGGSWPGWRSKTVRQPGRHTSVALLTSCDDDEIVSDTAMAIVDWVGQEC